MAGRGGEGTVPVVQCDACMWPDPAALFTPVLCSVVVDTSECGDLASCTLMKPYKESQQFSKLGDDGTAWLWHVCGWVCVSSVIFWPFYLHSFADQMNYSVDVFDNGKVLSIVTTGGLWTFRFD